MKLLFSKFDNSFMFLYSPAKWWFLLNKIFNKEYKPVLFNEVSFQKMPRDKVASVFKSSKCVLDIQRFGQSGLTMRTFEVLASGAILVTTNQRIKEADFYSENHIVIIDSNNIELSIQEIKNKMDGADNLKPIDVNKYCITSWVKDFFDE